MICFRLYILIFFCLSFFISTNIFSQQKVIQAIKIAKPPKIDGILEDDIWKNASIAKDFIINQPQFGKPASEATEVKVLYDDEAIYVSAKLYDNPKNIRTQLTARDKEDRQDVDVFSVIFDTYNDKQNAFQFTVTSANVQTDARISNTQGDNGGIDKNWDAVWDSKVKIMNDGWVVEIKIPYMSLRFSKKDVQDWGINFYRFMRRINEASYWNAINPQQNGFVNQFGLIKGFQNLNPPLRLSLLPYVSTGYSTIPTNNGTINTFLKNGGMDVKYGVNESFTLDMTLIPDFGQVQSDNVILNLSPFELQFNENRPFFTEGTELFNKAGIFYSRRVGGTPSGYYAAKKLASDSNYTITSNSSTTQLYNASKFSGRTNKNLGIGIFNAIAAPVNATFKDSYGQVISMQTEPLTNYNIIVLDQALKNRSSIAFTNTNVSRKGGSRNANVAAIDVSLFDKRNRYNFKVSTKYSSITGKQNYNGFKNTTTFSKVSGIWQWELGNNIESDQFDPNDLGFLRAPNEITNFASISFNQFTPNKYFNFRRYSFQLTHGSLYKPYVYTDLNYRANFLHVFKNFWDARFIVSGDPIERHDYFELRTPNRMMRKLPYWFTGIYGSSDSRKKMFIRYGFGYADLHGNRSLPYYNYNIGGRYRFNDKLSIDIDNDITYDTGEFGFSHFSNAEPIIGLRYVNKVSSILTTSYNFKARMNLSIRARHFWSKVQYQQFYTVDANGFWQNNQILFLNGYDRNFNAFNIDAFFTWDFRLGSRLVLAWKNAVGPDVAINGNTNKNFGDNVLATLAAPHSNEVSARFIYFIDYNQLKRKKKV